MWARHSCSAAIHCSRNLRSSEPSSSHAAVAEITTETRCYRAHSRISNVSIKKDICDSGNRSLQRMDEATSTRSPSPNCLGRCDVVRFRVGTGAQQDNKRE